MSSSPSSIGPYEIVERLGAGGMAELYAARRKDGSGPRVAMKVILPHLAKQSRFVDMFLDEARVMKRIDHPNVVDVLELGEADGQHFMVMEYVDGCTLGSVMDRAVRDGHPVPVEVAVRIASRALNGLHAAHECRGHDERFLDVVHRDVSPQNILVGHDGRVKLIDFGIAKARGRLHQTENCSIKGKLRYMAPEHCAGGRVDRRTDVYALAVVLWEMLTLRPYFDGRNDLDLIRQVRRPTFRAIAPWNADVAPDLEAVLRRALHPDPRRRFQSARAFRMALLAACPEAHRVGPPHVAAFVSSLGEVGTAVASTTRTGRARRRAALAYTFHVVVPKGGHDENAPETKILDGSVRRMAIPARYENPRRPRGSFAWLVAAVLTVCFMGGASGVAVGHVLVGLLVG